MTDATQLSDISQASYSELVKLIISEQFFILRCSAKPAASGKSGSVDCVLPNTVLKLANGNKKRIMKTIPDVPIGFMVGTSSTFDEIHGVVLCSNYPTEEIETQTIADLSCVNVSGGKCLFLPAAYEGEFVKELFFNALEKITIGANGSDIKGVAVDGCEVTIPINQGGAEDVVTSVTGGSGSPAVGVYAPTELKGTITSASTFVFAAKTKPVT